MRNYLQFFGAALTMSLFWLIIYSFGDQIIAAWLAGIFAVIAMAVLSWLAFKFLILLKVQSKREFDNIRKGELAGKVLFKKS
ncbi:hypothetical protein GXP67_25050 [Rhodocytophaga rosea]|uniref:Uncharacterized protein n=1 Tax=Rhodocytophaga rosea TaxID=2704465 RepID=A0A6C0GQ90_9BACT|nr:hypothetical protein [Rhodocytophaga rosea]QHT69680.1 hypothetical protein GXP67_25050 [Rhodocytophaga rosea]